MDQLYALLDTREPSSPLPAHDARQVAERLRGIVAREVYPRSIVAAHQAVYFLCAGEDKVLGILYGPGNSPLGFEGSEAAIVLDGTPLTLQLCPTTYTNATALHRAFPFTAPSLLGLETSAGCGDRLGLATPGHVRAIRKTDIAPIFAQQSIREMERTLRTPEDVINDATWGVFQEGWRGGYGADADHLKSFTDIDVCVAAGFTFYTFDPREHVDNDAHTDPLSMLRGKLASLPWNRLKESTEEMRGRYLKTFSIEGGYTLTFDETSLFRAACKYGKALAHVAGLYRHLKQVMRDRPFEVEVSVDETDTTTSPEEHFFIASELRRLGVSWVSLAPRYVGRFEKGVDYIGDLEAFDAAVAKHAAIARCCGPYKLSIHSGSDKFSIYPAIARQTNGLVHLKTAGTSYLEALRAIAEVDPQLFREILTFSFERYDEDRATYHVSAAPEQALRPDDLADDELTQVLDNFHNRQMLHVTFGSALTERLRGGGYRFRDRFFAVLRAKEETYYRVLEAHFDRHLEPFQ
jgi:tagaturonate epimerase